MAGKTWSLDEDALVIKHYRDESADRLKSILPNRTWVAIKIRAARLGVNRNSDTLCRGDPSPLLDEALESYYWIGFILADGYISDSRLKVTLSKKDKDHVEKLASYVGTRVIEKRNIVSFSIKHSSIRLLADKFNISSRKTYSPPDISWIKGDKLIAMLIGYIDGDGSISRNTKRKDCHITIKCHKSWRKTLDYFKTSLYTKLNLSCSMSRIDSYGYVVLYISDIPALRYLVKFARINKLPIMERKWSKIDTSLVSRYEVTKHKVSMIEELLNKGYSQSYIAKELGASESGVSSLIKRNSIIGSKKRGNNKE